MEKIKPSEVAFYLSREYIIVVDKAKDVKDFLQTARYHGYVYANEDALLFVIDNMPAFGFRMAYDHKHLITCRIDEYIPGVLVQFENDCIAFLY